MAVTQGFQVSPVRSAPLTMAQLPIVSGGIDPNAGRVDLAGAMVQGVAAGSAMGKPLADAALEMSPDKQAERALKRREIEFLNSPEGIALIDQERQLKGAQTRTALSEAELNEEVNRNILNSRTPGGRDATAVGNAGPLAGQGTTFDQVAAAKFAKMTGNRIPGKLEGEEIVKNRLKRISELNLPSNATDEEIQKAGREASAQKSQQQWTDVDSKAFSAIDQSEKDLDNIMANLEDFNSGPIVGRIASANPWNIDVAQINAMIDGAIPNLARGPFKEVGILTDSDMKRYRKQFPGVTTVKELQPKLFADLSEKLYNARIGGMNSLKDKNADVSRIEARYLKEGKIALDENGNYVIPPEKMQSIRTSQGRRTAPVSQSYTQAQINKIKVHLMNPDPSAPESPEVIARAKKIVEEYEASTKK